MNLRQMYLRKQHPENLLPFEKHIYSQNGEDGIIAEILHRIGVNSKYAVEIGVEDGSECNTRLLKEQDWQVLQIDGKDNPEPIKKEFVTAENINTLFKKYDVPTDLDLLSIDIDSNDLYVWKELDSSYKPRMVIMEYNGTIAPCYSLAVKYDPKLVWQKTNYFGASLLALYRVARVKGYELVYCNDNGVNAFFVREDLMKGLVARKPIDAYRPTSFGKLDKFGAWLAHGADPRAFVTITEDLEVEQ